MRDGMKAKFVHVNLIARDWGVLARFYETVFGGPARLASGPDPAGW